MKASMRRVAVRLSRPLGSKCAARKQGLRARSLLAGRDAAAAILEQAVKSARRLNGGEVKCKQKSTSLELSVPENQRDPLDTIIELTLG